MSGRSPRSQAVISSGPSDIPESQALLPLSALAATLTQPRNEALVVDSRTSAINNRPRLCPEILSLRGASYVPFRFPSNLLNHKSWPSPPSHLIACQPRPSHPSPLHATDKAAHARILRRFVSRANNHGSKQRLDFQDLRQAQGLFGLKLLCDFHDHWP